MGRNADIMRRAAKVSVWILQETRRTAAAVKRGAREEVHACMGCVAMLDLNSKSNVLYGVLSKTSWRHVRVY